MLSRGHYVGITNSRDCVFTVAATEKCFFCHQIFRLPTANVRISKVTKMAPFCPFCTFSALTKVHISRLGTAGITQKTVTSERFPLEANFLLDVPTPLTEIDCKLKEQTNFSVHTIRSHCHHKRQCGVPREKATSSVMYLM